jgi:hypothetical protein
MIIPPLNAATKRGSKTHRPSSASPIPHSTNDAAQAIAGMV